MTSARKPAGAPDEERRPAGAPEEQLGEASQEHRAADGAKLADSASNAPTEAHSGPEDESAAAVEIGWRLARPWWGQGLATEGARAVLADGFERVGLDEIVSIRHVDHEASARVMARLGVQFVRSTVLPSHGRWLDAAVGDHHEVCRGSPT